MKKFLIYNFILFLLGSCMISDYTKSYAVVEKSGRSYLKNMEYKKTFDLRMADYIDDKVVYLFERKPSVNVPRYVIIRFFKTGQWVRFVSNDYPNASLVNDLKRGNFIGYYNYKKNKILTEEPNLSFNKSGRRNIHYFEIDNNTLIQLKTPFKLKPVYKKTIIDNMQDVKPDW